MTNRIKNSLDFGSLWKLLEKKLDKKELVDLFDGIQDWNNVQDDGRYWNIKELELLNKSEEAKHLAVKFYNFFEPLIAQVLLSYSNISWFCIYFLNEQKMTHDYLIFFPKIYSKLKLSKFTQIYDFARSRNYYEKLDNSSSILFEGNNAKQRKLLIYSFNDIPNKRKYKQKIDGLVFSPVRLFDFEFDKSIDSLEDLISYSDSDLFNKYKNKVSHILNTNNDLYKLKGNDQIKRGQKLLKMLRYFSWLGLVKKEINFDYYYYFPAFLHSQSKVGGIVIASNDCIVPDDLVNIQYYSNRFFSSLALVFIERLKESLEKSNLKSAIISILVDSFAHNISAHSLAAIEHWFQLRSQFLERKIYLSDGFMIKNILPEQQGVETLRKVAKNFASKYYKNIGLSDSTNTKEYISLLDFISFFSEKTQEEFLKLSLPEGILAEEKADSELYHSPRIPIPLDHYLKHFIRFMRDKSAFWSGVTRDLPFGGEVKNLYDIFWNYFTSNALYLGTIAHSEGVVKLNIKFKIHRRVREFALIDLSVIDYERNLLEEQPMSSNDLNTKIGHSRYNFIRLGKDHNILRKFLSKQKVFFPGGIVGIHSLFTILENTLRNIKHYKNSPAYSTSDNTLEGGIQNEGIDLLIKIVPSIVSINKKTKRNKKKNLIEIEVSLDHLNYLKNNDGKLVKDIMDEKYSLNVLDEDQKPRLGGSAQDKICAAMLFNNFFSSVNNHKTPRDKYYNNLERNFFWIGVREQHDQEDLSLGKISKYFHLWKGDFVFYVKRKKDLENENIARFKIVYIDISSTNPDQKKLIAETIDKGVIRIITRDDLIAQIKQINKFDELIKKIKSGKVEEQAKNENGLYVDDFEYKIIYNAWLRKFLYNKQVSIVRWTNVFSRIENFELKSDKNLERKFLIGRKKINENQKLTKDEKKKAFLKLREVICQRKNVISFAHGTPIYSDINIRSHGRMIENFCNGDQNLDCVQSHDVSYIPELIEIVYSRIIIIDDRIFERFDEGRRHILKSKLNIEVITEKEILVKDNKKNNRVVYALNKIDTKELNFLVIHLSAIESLNCKGKDINKFMIELFNRFPTKENKNKFKLIITTGRGRADWYDNLENKYKSYTIFRPIESLLSAITDANSLKDEFDLKYNIVKVIFGS